MNFLFKLMYFYWKISYFGNFQYTAPGQPGGPRLYQGGAGPPWPHAGYGPGRGKLPPPPETPENLQRMRNNPGLNQQKE